MADMPAPGEGPAEDQNSLAWQARRLLRAAPAGSLATTSQNGPYVALVTPATAPDLSPLLLLSSLSAHTRHLLADPRCGLLVQGDQAGPNPQTAPRLSITGTARQVEDADLRTRWLARHPYASFYAGFGDFSLWRITITSAQFVGGFASAAQLDLADFLPDPAHVATVAAASADIMAHCNRDHADTLAKLAGATGEVGWRMAAVDCDGCDLWSPHAETKPPTRIAWDAPMADALGVRAAMIRLARRGRLQ
jgi:putative heme iron utilization protein